MSTSRKLKVAVASENGERIVTVMGRDAWALSELMAAGSKGCTPIDNPAPRWSHYVWKIRQTGIEVETVTENHGGEFAGHHARYVLKSAVRIIERGGEAPDRQIAA